MTASQAAPVLIDFAPGSKLEEKTAALSLPSTRVVFSDGAELPLPFEQIVHRSDLDGAVRIGLGGMSFEGIKNEQLIFWRVCDVLPEELQSPQFDPRMTLEANRVARILVQGRQVWPAQTSA